MGPTPEAQCSQTTLHYHKIQVYFFLQNFLRHFAIVAFELCSVWGLMVLMVFLGFLLFSDFMKFISFLALLLDEAERTRI